jgi:hypothetical protein
MARGGGGGAVRARARPGPSPPQPLALSPWKADLGRPEGPRAAQPSMPAPATAAQCGAGRKREGRAGRRAGAAWGPQGLAAAEAGAPQQQAGSWRGWRAAGSTRWRRRQQQRCSLPAPRRRRRRVPWKPVQHPPLAARLQRALARFRASRRLPGGRGACVRRRTHPASRGLTYGCLLRCCYSQPAAARSRRAGTEVHQPAGPPGRWPRGARHPRTAVRAYHHTPRGQRPGGPAEWRAPQPPGRGLVQACCCRPNRPEWYPPGAYSMGQLAWSNKPADSLAPLYTWASSTSTAGPRSTPPVGTNPRPRRRGRLLARHTAAREQRHSLQQPGRICELWGCDCCGAASPTPCARSR